MFPMLHGLVSQVRALVDILRDAFTTTESAPMVSPRTCEPGPGTLTIVDTGNKLSIASGLLTLSTVTGAFSDPRVSNAATTRTPGRAFIVTDITGSSWRIGWANSGDTSVRSGGLALSGGFYHYDNGVAVGQKVLKASVTYSMLIIQQNWGAMLAVKGGAWADWSLLGIATNRDVAALNGEATQKIYWDYNSAGVTIGEIAVQDWGGNWSRSYNYAQVYEFLPTSGDTYTATSGDMYITISWVPASGTVLDLMFRRTDDNNTWVIRGSQSGSTIKLFEKVAGVETERGTAAFTWGTAVLVHVWVRAEAGRIAFGVTGQSGVYTSGTYNSGVTGIKVTSTGSNDLAFMMAWGLTLPALPTSPGARPFNIFALGDSKTGGSGDDPLPAMTGGYIQYLCQNLETARGAGAFERPARYSLGGGTSVTIESALTGQLSSRAHVADYVLVNIGANDATAGTSEANFKTAYGSILDKCHTKYPAAEIHCMLVWVRDYLSQCNSINTWIAAVIADGRSSWAFVGPDERVFLEGGDNGVTYTADGVHPNHAGYLLTAQKWQEAMGF